MHSKVRGRLAECGRLPARLISSSACLTRCGRAELVQGLNPGPHAAGGRRGGRRHLWRGRVPGLFRGDGRVDPHGHRHALHAAGGRGRRAGRHRHPTRASVLLLSVPGTARGACRRQRGCALMGRAGPLGPAWGPPGRDGSCTAETSAATSQRGALCEDGPWCYCKQVRLQGAGGGALPEYQSPCRSPAWLACGVLCLSSRMPTPPEQ